MKTANIAAVTLSLTSAVTLVMVFSAPVVHGLPTAPGDEPDLAVGVDTPADPDAAEARPGVNERTRRGIDPLLDCVLKIYVWVHTSTTGGTGGGTNQVHKIELELNSGSTYDADLYDQVNTDQATIGKSDFWELSLFSDFGIILAHSSWPLCVKRLDIKSLTIKEAGNDGWLIDSVVTIMESANGDHRMFTFDKGEHRWIDQDASASQVGSPAQYDAKRWELNNGDFC